MHVTRFGSKKRPPLVILHGWGIDGSKFHQLASLLAKDWYVLVPDFPGFGQTPAPRKAMDVSDYAQQVKKMMKGEGIEQASFIGHSFGGRVTMKLASTSPKLVKSLILTGAAGVESWHWKRSLKRGIAWTAAKVLRLFTWIPPVRRLRDRFYIHRDFGKVEGVMKQTFLKVIKEKLDKDAKKIIQPTLLLWGSRDQLTPVRDAEKILKLIPHSRLQIFSGVGHNLPYKKPHEFAREVLQFLQQA